MARAMVITSGTRTISKKKEENNDHDQGEYCLKGVKHLCDNGITKLPSKYILPPSDRPAAATINNNIGRDCNGAADITIKLPVIDFADLHGPNRSQFLNSLAYACQNFGFFQLVNHGISSEVIKNMMEVGRSFFELPFEERQKYMSKDMRAPVRYGTSFNQTKDRIFCWRDFLKLVSHPLSDSIPHWPSSPLDFRQKAVTYANESKILFTMIVEAILESLILTTSVENKQKIIDDDDGDENYVVEEEILKELEDGSHLMVVNCYPPCPEPELTLGMPPHSDYGFLTLVLQDEVQGLQIQSQNKWVTIEPVPNSFVVNVGDHLEIFSNGRYKSVLHRVLANSQKPRVSVASLHSFPFESIVRPWTKLVNETIPRQYMDTDFSDFLNYLACNDSKKKNFLESRKLTQLNHKDRGNNRDPQKGGS